MVKSDSTSSESSPSTDKSSKTIFPSSKYFKYIVILIALFLLIGAIAAALIISYRIQKSSASNSVLPNSSSSDNNSNTLNIIEKQAWKGLPAQNPIPLLHPTTFVIFAHTVTQTCESLVKCSTLVLSIQSYHLSRKYSDIFYNFLIGHDGNVYEGRGWDTQSGKPNSISIAFIGDYRYNKLTDVMMKNTQNLLSQGVKSGKLSENYILLCHNQTSATLSPGVNVYNVVSQWPHFDPRKYNSTEI